MVDSYWKALYELGRKEEIYKIKANIKNNKQREENETN